ncbi:L,D-transpeptidase [Salipiger sp. CCB-MM3]|uniref:L,D-transpeptidase n=1 Tax=Salipiger sp. CCB-MM3 TaxID=1792508 RepID=UPI000A482C5E|nr:L,D-transpeptidase [Salipiger sp. CCB-MM3]
MNAFMTRRRTLTLGLASAAGLAMPALLRAQTTAPAPSVIQPQLVRLTTPLPANEVHVYPDAYRLFWSLPDGQAWIYAIRVGRDGLYEPGEYFVGAKKEWPSWTPTPGMIEREPEKYQKYADGGMPGGPGNPLGARALYLFTPERGDTFLRIHGTDDPGTIGRAVSNGCAGLINDQITLLYDQVPMNARVVLHPKRLGVSTAQEG